MTCMFNAVHAENNILYTLFLFKVVDDINTQHQGPVVQSFVSLTSSLRGQPVRCFTTLLPNTLSFFVNKMRVASALQKFLTFFQQKILAFLRY